MKWTEEQSSFDLLQKKIEIIFCKTPGPVLGSNKTIQFLSHAVKRLWWSRGSVLVFGTQVRRQIFKGQIKIFSTPSFGGEVKPSVPCRRFAAFKRSLNVTWKSTFRHNYRP